MKKLRIIVTLLVVAPAGGFIACEKKVETPPPIEGAPTAQSALTAPARPAAIGLPSAAPPPAAPDSAPVPGMAAAASGPAYLVVAGRGIVKIDAGKVSLVAALPKVRAMALAKDGAIYTSGFDGVHKIPAGRGEPEQIGDWRSGGSLDQIAFGGDGHVWGTSFKGVAQWNGNDWTTHPKALLGAGVMLLRDIAVDATGRVWVASSNAVHVREAGAWKTPHIEVSRKPIFVSKIAIDGDSIYALHSSGVVKLEGETFQEVPVGKESFLSTYQMAAAAGTIHVWTTSALYRVAPGKGTQRLTTKKAGFRAKTVGSLAADAAGRSWLTTDHGLVVVDRAGKATQYAPGTLELISGEVKQVAVVAGGPALPPVGAQAKGGVTGKLIRDGAPVVGVDLEICASPSMYFRGSPCRDAAFNQRATTGMDGTFKFVDVPLGQYRFAIKKPGAKWTMTMSPCCQGMRKGQTYDIGSMTLSK